MNLKISNFGLARIFSGNQTQGNTARVVGTLGYMSPEYAAQGLFSEKSDVFSFGVLLLEIVSGKRNTGFLPNEQWSNLLGYAWKLWNEGRGLEIMDPSISDSKVAHEVDRCIHVGLLCVEEDPTDRPTMPSIVLMLGKSARPPSPKQPAFSTWKSLTSADPSVDNSVNDVTICMIEPRP
ncbi:G-type lectin S-receptor-like serine/threonine-protein kinase At4g03230 [Magnolia sinica]|uniref:G-type lectin S-receptor-like serine/threonine-protein kinase At4g03230 n=1 Tax=Magnolia sinica TaxID=86752 RepID=UPI00265A62BE|nr:G-type lectin S-receptor-like serine/threonine-protein kinase At4g03230 [Magnolia sinica]